MLTTEVMRTDDWPNRLGVSVPESALQRDELT